MVNTEINKIKEITKIINDNVAEPLERTEVKAVFQNIISHFELLFKDASDIYKPVIKGKAQAILAIINKNINEEPRWMETQGNLNQIKDILTGLGNEIILLEQQAQTQPVKTSIEQTTTVQTPTTTETTTQRKSFSEQVGEHEKVAIEMMKAGAEKEGILGAATGTTLGTLSVFTTGLGQLWDNAATDVKETYTKTMATAADTYKTSVAEAGKVATEVAKGGIEAQGLWGTKLKFGGSSTDALKAENEALKKQLEEKDKLLAEKDKQIALYERLINK